MTVIAFLEGALERENLTKVEAHIDTCPDCRRLVSELGRTSMVAHPAVALSPDGPTVAEFEQSGTQTMQVGGKLGRYVILEMIGRGGMGTVYAAYDPQLDRKVALKVLNGGLVDQSPMGEGRLTKEARAMAKLDHANVVSVYELGTADDIVFLAMEFVAGKTARHWLASSPRSWKEILSLFMAAGRGLAAAHSAGIVHRDFKPENVLVGRDGIARVADFGLARSPVSQLQSEPPYPANAENVAATTNTLSAVTGTLVGTPAYMAPEQRLGKTADHRSDQFSFAVALHEALFGERPDEEHFITSSAQLPSAIDRSRVSRPPQRVANVIARALRTDPEQRYASMDAFLAALGKRPAVTWKRVAAATAIVCIFGGVIGAGIFSARQQRQLCLGGEQQLASVWGPARKEAVRAATLATAVPNAADVGSTVERHLDRYAEKWLSMHFDTCAATRLRGEQSEELLDLRMACLGNRLHELDVVARLLAASDGKSVSDAPKLSFGLTDISECADTMTLQGHEKLPQGDEAQTQLRVLEKQVIEGAVMTRAGRSVQTIELLNKTLSAARELKYLPLVASASLTLGRGYANSRNVPQAREYYKHALQAAEASGEDSLAAEALIASLLDITPGSPEAASRNLIVDLAESKIERAKRRGATSHFRQQVLLLRARAFYQFESGKFEEAIDLFKAALAVADGHLSENDPLTIIVLQNVGGAFQAARKLDDAQPYLARTLSLSEEAFGLDHLATALARQAMAGNMSGRGKLAEAREELLKVVSVLTSTLGASHEELATALTNLGNVELKLGNPQKALELYRRALAMTTELPPIDPARLGLFYLAVGEGAQAIGQYSEALEMYAQGEKIIQQVIPNHPYLAEFQGGIGRTYFKMGKTARAAAVLEKAIAKGAGTFGDATDAGEIRFIAAQALWKTNRVRANVLVREAREIYVKAGELGRTKLGELEHWLGVKNKSTKLASNLTKTP